MDVKTLRVHAPTSLLFLCGGPLDVKSFTPVSLRDSFLRIANKDPFTRHKIILAEELNPFFPRGKYTDIMSLESDIAQISELIVLFSESYGSVAELGAFSMSEEIAKRLLVIMDDGNYGLQSFITLGPIRALENQYSNAICVINRKDINISDVSDTKSIDLAAFSECVSRAISVRSQTTREPTTFKADRHGHLIKLIVGFVQHYRSLTIDEIEVLLYCIDIKLCPESISNFLLCAEFAGWIVRDKRGLRTFFSACTERTAIQYKFVINIRVIDRTRWSADIVDYWKANDPDRFNSIRAALEHQSR